jgi:hypothetical protein
MVRKQSSVVQVSQTRVKTWRACQRQHYNRYTLKLQRKVKRRPLQFGTIIHQMLEAFHSGLDPFKVLKDVEKKNRRLFAAERELYGDIVIDARTIFSEYLEWYKGEKTHYIKYQGRQAEHELEVEIADGIIFVLKVDGFIRRADKLRFILENKTFSRMPNEDERWRDLQSSVYLWACDQLGLRRFNGICWNYIKSKPPTRPKLLKSGELSITHIDTLPSVVRDTIKEHGLKEKDYKVLLQRAKENIPTYFRRVYTPVNERVRDALFNEFVESSIEIAQDAEKPEKKRKRVMCIGRHCSWCDFEPLCRAELTGGDISYIRRKEYEIRKKEDTDKVSDKVSE